MAQSFAVYYRAGGTLACTWTRVLDVFNAETARAKAAEIERMGYHAIVNDAAKTASLGLPIGWDSKSVDWDADQIEIHRAPDGMMLATSWRASRLL